MPFTNFDDVESWDADLTLIFACIGQAMNGRRLTPQIVQTAAATLREIIPDHVVTIEHTSGAVTKAPHYTIQIAGPAWAGNIWTIRSGKLERLCRAAAVAKI